MWKKFHIKKYHLDRYKHHCCSKECSNKLKSKTMSGKNNHQYGVKGSSNSSWKSDIRITSYGYKKIRMLNHPFKDSNDMVFEHRLIAEKYLLNDENSIEIDGVLYLSPEYEVHHINQNKLDNNIENLKVLTKSEHRRIHNLLDPRDRDNYGRFIGNTLK